MKKFNVIKGKTAHHKYGPKAEHGVVEIYLKKKFSRTYIRNKLRKRKIDRVKDRRERDRRRNHIFSPDEMNSPKTLHLYPNPANAHINFSFESKHRGAKIRYYILDLQGRIQGEINELQLTGKLENSINISKLSLGQYFFIVEENDVRYQKAFEVVR